MAEVKKPEQRKNRLSERIKDMTQLVIAKGHVLLEVVEPSATMSGIVLPDTMDKTGIIYYKVIKTGDDDFKKTHPDFIGENITKVGNIVITIKEGRSVPLTNSGKTYIVVHESFIEAQVTPDNYDVVNLGTR